MGRCFGSGVNLRDRAPLRKTLNALNQRFGGLFSVSIDNDVDDEEMLREYGPSMEV